MNASLQTSRRGISLLEVLISIGILAIGLSAVVALVPAGKSEAGKAVILDRATALAMNTLNDAVTFGLTRPATIPANAGFVVFDLLGATNWPTATTGAYKTKGIFASGTSDVDAGPLLSYVLQGRDDLVYTAPKGDDDPPTNSFSSDGVRSFQGRTTSLVSIAGMSSGTTTLQAGDLAKVTAVVFHNRSTSISDAIVSGTYVTGTTSVVFNNKTVPAGTILIPPASLPSDRTLKDSIRPGTVIYSGSAPPANRWLQVGMASVDEAAGIVYVTFVGDVEPSTEPVQVQIALDSVGLAERLVTLEGPGPYGQ